ncbi:MAG: phosphoenolpyruvate--protein phosphotransferase [Candidatus Sumerlaeota bacterium]|nr:phosphoenolpyruvate--protein phosphotransferase [Candidatus Sumerlaeota bacterium]
MNPSSASGHANLAPQRTGLHRVFRGIPASPGVAFGPAFLFTRQRAGVEVRTLKPSQVDEEIKRFRAAVAAAKEDVRHARAETATAIDATLARIFEGHLGLLEDPELIDKAEDLIRAELRNAESVVAELIEKQVQRIQRLKDPKLAGVAADLRDVGDRLLSQMGASGGSGALINPAATSVLVAHDLAPSETAHLMRDRVAGFATDMGGPVSHTALLAKALELPAVVGLECLSAEVAAGTPLIVDGFSGRVIANPTSEEVRNYRMRRREWRARDVGLRRLRLLPAETRDGYVIDLAANIELPSEVEHVLEHGADGIGLFRTEFLYLEGEHPPSEQEQYDVYRQVLRRVNPKPVVFRTFDLGGDKFLSHVTLSQELNPFLGLRAIRLCLRYPELFKTQLRAILRASRYGKARIMFPLVSSLAEVREARLILEQVKEELKSQRVAFDDSIEVGIMVEVPSAALAADTLAREVDFFSLGTNDLIQYTLAVDRVNSQVAHLYDPYHPSVLRLIREVIESAHRNGIWVGLCGEMASDPDLACLLVGMGIDELSMAAGDVPTIKQRLRGVTIEDLRRLAADVSTRFTSSDIRVLMAERAPQLSIGRARRAAKE